MVRVHFSPSDVSQNFEEIFQKHRMQSEALLSATKVAPYEDHLLEGYTKRGRGSGRASITLLVDGS